MVKYSFPVFDPKTGERLYDPKRMTRAYGKELDISPKHAVELTRKLKGMTVKKAEEYLFKVIRMEQAVPFRKYGSAGHRKGGMGPGKYPVKASKKLLKLLKEVTESAKFYLETEPSALKIIHMSSYKGVRVDSWFTRAHGRSSPKRREKVNVEIIVEKIEEMEG